MDKRISEVYPQKLVQILFLLGFCLVLYLFNLNRWDLWNPDEPRYAQVAREMVNSGDWVMMHFNGKTYADKPPVFFWLIALSSYLWQGFNSFSVRFPSAFFGTLTVLLTFFLGKNLYTSRTGFLSGLVLATSFEFAYLSTRANIDTTLTFFTTASLYCFYYWYGNKTPHPRLPKNLFGEQASPLPQGERSLTLQSFSDGAEGVRGSFPIYGFYIAMALATLSKGPVGFILPLFVSLIYLIIQRDWRGVKGMRLLTGMILLMLIVLSWYLPAILRGGGEYLNETILSHTFDRFAKGSSHLRPFFYHLYNFPMDFLPWIFFLPAAVVYGFSREVEEKRKQFLFLLIWFVVIFLFFSVSKGKRGIYLLPLFPAVSLMVGKLWDDFISISMEHFHHGWISFPLHLFIGLALIAGAAIPWVVSARFSSYLPYSLPIAFLMAGGGLALFILNRFKYRTAIFFILIGIVAGGFFYTLRVVFPLVNPYKSARFISQEITSRIQPGEKLGLYGDFGTGPYNFYTGIVPILELEKEGDLIRFLQSQERVFCLLKFRDFSKFQAMEDRPKVQLLARRNVGGDDIMLISNR